MKIITVLALSDSPHKETIFMLPGWYNVTDMESIAEKRLKHNFLTARERFETILKFICNFDFEGTEIPNSDGTTH